MKTKARILALLLVLCMVFGAAASYAEAPKKGGSAVLQAWADPTSINFYADYGSAGSSLNWTCGAMLVTYNADMELVPLLLKDWQLSDDSLTWTMTIRDNAGWSDGTPITVDDIIFSVEYFRQDSFQDYIFQADTMYFSETPVYEKVDDYTYTITTTVPYPTVFDFYAVNCFILPKHVFENIPASEFHNASLFTDAKQVACGGPFAIDEFKPGEYVRCVRNEYFWDEVYLDELYWRLAADPNSMYTALKTGDLDFTFGIGSKFTEAEADNYQIFRTNAAAYNGIVMNTKDPILSDIKIRKAICHIYDQQVLIDQYYGGQATLNKSIIKGMRYEDEASCVYYEHDVEKARALIEEAGWTLGDDGYYQKDGVTLEINFAYEAGYDDYTAIIMETMFKDTGVKFTYTGYEANVLSDMSSSGDFQLINQYASLGPDPANYYSNYTDTGLFGYYRTDALDQAWIDGMNGGSDEARQLAYSTLQKELSDGAVWLVSPKSWGYYFANNDIGLDEAQFTSYGMFSHFNRIYSNEV